MKIYNNNSIRITARLSGTDVFRNLNEGSTVTARIIERLGPKDAILDIRGSRVKAEFLKGVPLNSSISLSIDNRTENAIFLKIVYNREIEDSFNKLLEYTLFNPAEFKKNGLLELSRYISKNLSDLFLYNSFLLGLKEGRERKSSSTDLLNNLLKSGIKKETLIYLSYILNNLKNEQLYLLLMLFGHKLKLLHDPGKTDRNDNDPGKMLNDLFEEIEELDSGEKTDIINKILYLFSKDTSEENVSSGEIPYYENDRFKAIKYIINKNLAFFSFNLSYLKKTDVLINNQRSGLIISIFSENDTILNVLKEDLPDMEYSLKRYFKNIDVNFYCAGNVIEKIIEINSSLSFNNQLDVIV